MREFWKDSGVQRMPMRKLQENFRVWAAPRGICPLTTTGLRYMCYSIGMKKEVKSDGCTYMYKEGA